MTAPKLRFKFNNDKDYPEWTEKTLEEITDVFKSGHGITADRISAIGKYPVYGGNGMRGYSDVYTHDGRYALIGRQGALCGNVNLIDGKNFVSEHAIAVKANRNSSTDWLAIKLEMMNLNRLSESSAQPGLAVNKLLKLKLNVPSYEEQERISSFINLVNSKTKNLTRQYELLIQYRKGVMQKIFANEIRFKNRDGKDFPAWIRTTLGEIGSIKSGIGFPDAEQGGVEGVPFLKVSDMNLPLNQVEMVSSNNYVSEEQIKRLKFKVINSPSIIFAKVGAAIFLERKRIAKNFLIDNNMMAFIPRVNINFAKCLLDTVRLSKYAQSGALPSYNASDILTIPVDIPTSEAEQCAISDFINLLDKRIALTADIIQLTMKYKQGLLQQMFV